MRNNFEQSVTKASIRARIVNQMLSYSTATRLGSVPVAVLPGAHWLFEQSLISQFDAIGTPVHLHAFEKDSSIFYNGHPLSRTSALPVNFLDEGREARHTISYKQRFFSFDDAKLAWADYCGAPSEINLNPFCDWMNNGGELGYVTVQLGTRAIGAVVPEMLENNYEGATYNERAQMVADYIELNLTVKNKEVFRWIYRSGGYTGEMMLTIGFMRTHSRPACRYVKPFTQLVEDNARPMSAPAPFNDKALAAKVFYHSVVLRQSAAQVAEACGVSSMKVGGIKVSLLYKDIKKNNLMAWIADKIKTLSDVES